MTDSEILVMLERIIEVVDYDTAKSIFNDECCEDIDIARETRSNLIRIVRDHVVER